MLNACAGLRVKLNEGDLLDDEGNPLPNDLRGYYMQWYIKEKDPTYFRDGANRTGKRVDFNDVIVAAEKGQQTVSRVQDIIDLLRADIQNTPDRTHQGRLELRVDLAIASEVLRNVDLNEIIECHFLVPTEQWM